MCCTQVKWELDRQCGQDTLPPDVVVGVFLVKEGAQIHAANRLGVHPLSLKPSDVVQLLNRYATATHSRSLSTFFNVSLLILFWLICMWVLKLTLLLDPRPSFHGTLRQKDSPVACISPKTPRKPMVRMYIPSLNLFTSRFQCAFFSLLEGSVS